ncbi:protein disulfide-isomerase A4-like [Mangifera indica]|uniref:protein disulfide-isomerase A4-like n=1 Tax=Mangifera indica TaxID=29780 RepID=UPI001CFBCDD4|nr:protein disulfide-isomerase A4-like [Mangifera indica]
MPTKTEAFLYTIVLLLFIIHLLSPYLTDIYFAYQSHSYGSEAIAIPAAYTHIFSQNPDKRSDVVRNFLDDQMKNFPAIIEEKQVVKVLSEESFSLFVANNRYVMVVFHASWSPLCRKLAPEYAEAARELKGEVVLAKVYADKEKGLEKKYGIKGYPTCYFFVGGVNAHPCNFVRKRDAIVKWAKSHMGLGVYTIMTTEQFEEVFTSNSTIVLSFLDSLQGPETEELLAASMLHPDVIFYQTASANLARRFHNNSEIKLPALIMQQKESQHLSYFNGPFTESEIAYFISVNKIPPMNTLTMVKFPEIFKRCTKQEMSPPAIDEKAVVVLSAKNFAHVVAKNRYVMVAFYAPWCYWSRQLDPEYEKAAMELKAELVLAKVDAAQETFLANKYAIDGYPTISFFVGGVKVYNYYHERKSDDIVRWARKKMDLGIYTIKTTEQAEQLLMAEYTIVLAFLESLQGLESKDLAAVSNLHGDVIFYQTTSADVAKIFHIDPDIKRPAIVLLEREAQKLNHFNGTFTKNAIADFVFVNKLPPVTTFTNENALQILKSPVKQLWLFALTHDFEVRSIFQEVAEAFKGKLLFVYMQMDCQSASRQIAQDFGSTGHASAGPIIVSYSGNSNGKKYVLYDELSIGNIKSFAENFMENKLPSLSNSVSKTFLTPPYSDRFL